MRTWFNINVIYKAIAMWCILIHLKGSVLSYHWYWTNYLYRAYEYRDINALTHWRFEIVRAGAELDLWLTMKLTLKLSWNGGESN